MAGQLIRVSRSLAGYSWLKGDANTVLKRSQSCVQQTQMLRRCISVSSVNYQKTKEVERASYRSRRAVMYVPLSDERKYSKIPSLGADTVVLDCEDGVATNQKVCIAVGVVTLRR